MDIPEPGIEVDSDGFRAAGLHWSYYEFDFKSNILLNCKSKKTVKIQTLWKEIQKLIPAGASGIRNVTLKKKILKSIDKILQIDDNLPVALYNKGILLVDEWGYPHQHLNDEATRFLGKACGIRPKYIKFLEKTIERLEDDHWKDMPDIRASYGYEIDKIEKIIEETQDIDHVIKNFLDCWDVIELLEFGKILTKYLRYEESLQFFDRANEIYPSEEELARKYKSNVTNSSVFRDHSPNERPEITHNEVKKLFKKAVEDAFHKKYKDLTVLEKKYLAYISLQNYDPRIINPIEFRKSFNQWKTTYCRIKLKSKK